MIGRVLRRLAPFAAAFALLFANAGESAAQSPQISAAPALFPAFNSAVTDYVTRCQPSNQVQVSVSAPAGTQVSVDNAPPQTGSFTQTVALTAGQSFDITSSESGQTATYYIRCLPSDFPAFTATRTGPTQAAFYAVTPNEYFAPSGVSRQYAALFDNNGVPVWWMRSSGTTQPDDLKLLANGDLIWLHQWPSSPAGAEEHRLDGTLVHSLSAVPGGTNQHDVQLLPNGDYLLTRAYVLFGVDLSGCGGPVNGSVQDAQLQEITPSGTLVWSWDAAAHIPASEMAPQWRAAYCTSFAADVYHWNSVEPDGDGLVLSFRHLDAVYRIDRATGAIDWKLGGTRRPESLSVIGDPFSGTSLFCGQHDPRVLSDGTLTVFDDGTGCNRPPRSVRYVIDTTARTATLAESIKNPAVPYSSCCGSTRKLPGGDWVTAWGATRYVTEQNAAGAVIFKLTFTQGLFSYRANPVLPTQLSAAALRTGMDAQYPR